MKITEALTNIQWRETISLMRQLLQEKVWKLDEIHVVSGRYAFYLTFIETTKEISILDNDF